MRHIQEWGIPNREKSKEHVISQLFILYILCPLDDKYELSDPGLAHDYSEGVNGRGKEILDSVLFFFARGELEEV